MDPGFLAALGPRMTGVGDPGHLAAARPQDDGRGVRPRLVALGSGMTSVGVRLGSVVPPDSRLPSSWGRRRRNPGSILLYDGVWHAVKAVDSEMDPGFLATLGLRMTSVRGSAAICCARPRVDGRWGFGRPHCARYRNDRFCSYRHAGSPHARRRHHSQTLVYQA